MPPTPNDLKNLADRNRETPEGILKRLINTITTTKPLHSNSQNPIELKNRATKQVLSRHLAIQLTNHARGKIMISGGTSLMLRAPDARITEDLDILTLFNPTTKAMDALCELMSEDKNDPFTYECFHADDIKSRKGNSFEIDVYLHGRFQSTIKMDAIKARGRELNQQGMFNGVTKLRVRDPLLSTHNDKKELTTLQLISPEKYLAGKIAGLFRIQSGKLQKVLRWKDLRDITTLATSLPIDSDKFQKALNDLVIDSHGSFTIPTRQNMTEFFTQAQKNRDYIDSGNDEFYQINRFSVETMVKVLSELLKCPKGSLWELDVHDPQLQNLENQQKSSRFTIQDLRNFDMKIWEVKDATTDKNTRSLHGAFDCECNKHVKLTDAKSTYYMTDPRELIEAGIPAQLMLDEGLEREEEVMSIQEEQWDTEEDEEWFAMREDNDEDDENELGL